MSASYNTLKYYEDQAAEYCMQTQNWDVTGLYTLFEKYLPQKAYILDFGCGSGRDSKHFLRTRLPCPRHRWIYRNLQTCK